MMNTEQIERTLRRRCGDRFDEVYSADALPDCLHLLVANTDPPNREGRHWVAICISDKHGEYFDSFERPPDKNFERYMNKHIRLWTYNDIQLQSVIGRFCGHYCIFFCALRCRGIDMCKIVASLTADTALNDAVVHRFTYM